MRHETAVEVTIHGVTGWHYASLSRRGGHPLGYCAEHPPHATETEARECYARYQRDHGIRLNAGRAADEQCRCEVCQEWTQDYATAGKGIAMHFLCPQHMTREHVIQLAGLNKPAGDAWTTM